MRRTERDLNELMHYQDILMRGDVCRLAINTSVAPYIVPLNYGYVWTDDGELQLFFHSAKEGRKLELLAQNNLVGFEIDVDHELATNKHACGWGMKYKSIIGTGEVLIVNDEDVKKMAMDLIMRHYGYSEETINYKPQIFKLTNILCLKVAEMSAKGRTK